MTVMIDVAKVETLDGWIAIGMSMDPETGESRVATALSTDAVVNALARAKLLYRRPYAPRERTEVERELGRLIRGLDLQVSHLRLREVIAETLPGTLISSI